MTTKYKITVRLYQTDPKAFFHIVEKTCWKDSYGWYNDHEQHVLSMAGSGTSGTLRISQHDDGPEEVIVALGVHNYKRWCDIITDLPKGETGAIANAEYYNGTRNSAREKVLGFYGTTGKTGRSFAVAYAVEEGNDLVADIVIGPTPS